MQLLAAGDACDNAGVSDACSHCEETKPAQRSAIDLAAWYKMKKSVEKVSKYCENWTFSIPSATGVDDIEVVPYPHVHILLTGPARPGQTA